MPSVSSPRQLIACCQSSNFQFGFPSSAATVSLSRFTCCSLPSKGNFSRRQRLPLLSPRTKRHGVAWSFAAELQMDHPPELFLAGKRPVQLLTFHFHIPAADRLPPAALRRAGSWPPSRLNQRRPAVFAQFGRQLSALPSPSAVDVQRLYCRGVMSTGQLSCSCAVPKR